MEKGDTFFIEARRCKRCGGILTSKQAVKDGYGHVCKLKTDAERKAEEINKDQITFFESGENYECVQSLQNMRRTS